MIRPVRRVLAGVFAVVAGIALAGCGSTGGAAEPVARSVLTQTTVVTKTDTTTETIQSTDVVKTTEVATSTKVVTVTSTKTSSGGGGGGGADYLPSSSSYKRISSDISYAWALDEDPFKCAATDSICWGIYVISKAGCDTGLEVDLSATDPDDSSWERTFNWKLTTPIPADEPTLVILGSTYETESTLSGTIDDVKCR